MAHHRQRNANAPPRLPRTAELLAVETISAHQLPIPTMEPPGQCAIVESAARTGHVVTAEDHLIVIGLRGAVAKTLSECYLILVGQVGPRGASMHTGRVIGGATQAFGEVTRETG